MAAARTALRLGARPLLVQSGPIGGECTFSGCVPSKTLISAAADGKTFDQSMARVRRSIATIAATEDDDVFGREGVDVAHGWATFRSPTELDVDGTR
ncbi:MAG: NAD(P)/FAD-dependent oxidoreductase, partial [Actinomycetota bacterium]|nr:NAD(P)/FAD-dependent oxidoreductase [Actinomycetota bacterium]